MIRRLRPRTRGFTLAELLVVVAIIGLLAALITPALYNVVLRARENRIAQELSQIHQAVEGYKQKHGDYPPDFSSIQTVADLSDANNILVRHLRKAFPKHQENLVTIFTVGGAGAVLNVPDRAEALVFWLTQIGSDPRKPLTGTGQKDVLFPFDETRLGTLPGHNWTCYVPKDGGETPYVYFDSRTYSNGRKLTGYVSASGQTVRPYARTVAPVLNDANSEPGYVNPTTFQIISAGLDAEFGNTPGNKYKIFPSGAGDNVLTTGPHPYPYLDSATNKLNSEDLDNITNFSDGRTLKENVP